METNETKELTAYQEMAEKCNLHPNALSMFQHRHIVPRDVADFKDEDIELLQKLAMVMKDPELIRLQLHRKTKAERMRLIEEAGDCHTYKNWERRALRMFMKMYESRKATGDDSNVTTVKVLAHIKRHFNVQTTRYIKHRVTVLKRIAAGRVAARQ